MEALKIAIKEYLKHKIGKNNINVEKIKEIPGGYLSRAYKVEVKIGKNKKNFFIKQSISQSHGYERNEDKLASYLTSQRITDLVGNNPKSIGCFIMGSDNKIKPIEPLDDKENVFQVQEFKEGRSYLKFLHKPKKNSNLNKKDKKEIEKIVNLLVKVHKTDIKIEGEETKRMLFKRTLRDIIGHPELTLTVFKNNLKDCKVFKGKFRYNYISEMIKVIGHFEEYYDRIAVIHGDFWPANILFDKDEKPFFIDYSRLCYGDPGIDVGDLYSYFIWLAIYKENRYYKKLADYFLRWYILKTGDKFIMNTAVTYMGFTCAVSLIEGFYPDATHAMRKKFANYVYNCLKKRKIQKMHF